MSLPKRPQISLIIPVFNESANLVWHHQKIQAFLKSQKIRAEIIYIDDGSTDNSRSIIKDFQKHDNSVRFICFSRNFGKEAATSAGLLRAKGAAAIIIDADGQHPTEYIRSFIDKWQAGYEVVIGVRTANFKEGAVKKYGSKLFYTLLNKLIGGDTIAGATDFRLLDRRVIDEFNKLTERNRMTRGLVDWLGFKREYVEFEALPRHNGEATYSFGKLVKLAIHGFVSHTTKPLQFTGFTGMFVMLFSASVGVFLIFEKYVFGDPLELAVTGTAILALFISLLIGLVLICQWLLALYVESIHAETQNRPLYVIREEE